MITPEQALAIYHAGPEAVVKVICDLSARVEAHQLQIDLLLRKVADLESKVAKLSKNSTNSSKPPSSDITRPKPQQRQQGKRKIGAQPGHPRHERPAFPEADIKTFHDYRLDACPECGNAEVTFLDEPPRVQQQIEIEEVIVRKEEHRSYPVWCERCQKVHYHPFPEAVVNEGLFKERLTALVAYMKSVDHASFSTIRKFVRDVLGENVSRGYLRKVVEKASAALEAPYEELLKRLPLEQALNVDETGHKDSGQRMWTWAFRAALYTVFKVSPSRGSDVLLEVLGQEFSGLLGCDYFSAYRKYARLNENVLLQFCLAHFIRDVKFLVEHPDPQNQAYGQRLVDDLRKLFGTIHRREEYASDATFRQALTRARNALLWDATLEAPATKEADNLAERFFQHSESHFRFISEPEIEPTNNLAE